MKDKPIEPEESDFDELASLREERDKLYRDLTVMQKRQEIYEDVERRLMDVTQEARSIDKVKGNQFKSRRKTVDVRTNSKLDAKTKRL